MPSLEGMKRVELSSSSSCVMVGRKKYKRYCLHTYVQVKNPDDVPRFGKALFYTLVDSGLVYQITIKSGEKVDRSIIDASVFQSNRISYEGRPTLVGEVLKLINPRIKAFSGDRVDTEKLKMPKLKDGLKYNSKTGTIESEDLSPDIPIETVHGTMTPAEYKNSEYYPNKVRCQTPFRPESFSMNGILRAHRKTGTVFFYDNGTGRKYTLKRKVFGSAGTATDMYGVFEDMTVTNELVEKYEHTQSLYEDVMTKGHIVGWIGKPGSGKTTLMKSFIEEIAKVYSVVYVMMDVGTDEIKVHQHHADKFNYKLVWPNGMNMSNKDVLEKIGAMGSSSMDLHNSVLIIDSTKKLVNVNQKDLAVEFLEVLRTANAKGLSIELLMHTTKYRDAEGNLIHAGTQDFIDDIDETNYVEFTRPDNDTQRIAVYPDKKRNTFVKPTSYLFKNKDRTVSRDKIFNDLKKVNEAGKKVRPNDNSIFFQLLMLLKMEQ